VVNIASNLCAIGHLYGLWNDCAHHFDWKLSTIFVIQYTLSFYIQIGVVAFFIIAFLFLSQKKLDSRRRLSEDMIDTLVEDRQVSLLTDRTADDDKIAAQRAH